MRYIAEEAGRRSMRDARGWATALTVTLGVMLAAAAPVHAGNCDEHNPASPSRSVRIALAATDAVDETSKELRTFVETGSLGKVDISFVRSSHRGPVQHIFAVPHVSRHSQLYGEEL